MTSNRAISVVAGTAVLAGVAGFAYYFGYMHQDVRKIGKMSKNRTKMTQKQGK